MSNDSNDKVVTDEEAILLAAIAGRAAYVAPGAHATTNGNVDLWRTQVLLNAMVVIYATVRTITPAIGKAYRALLAAQYLPPQKTGTTIGRDGKVKGVYSYGNRWNAYTTARTALLAACDKALSTNVREALSAAETAYRAEETSRVAAYGPGSKARYTKGPEASSNYASTARASAAASKRTTRPDDAAKVAAAADAADAKAFASIEEEADLPE